MQILNTTQNLENFTTTYLNKKLFINSLVIFNSYFLNFLF